MAVTREERMWEAMLNDAPEKIPTAVTRKEKVLKKLAKQACENDTFSGGNGGGGTSAGGNDGNLIYWNQVLDKPFGNVSEWRWFEYDGKFENLEKLYTLSSSDEDPDLGITTSTHFNLRMWLSGVFDPMELKRASSMEISDEYNGTRKMRLADTNNNVLQFIDDQSSTLILLEYYDGETSTLDFGYDEDVIPDAGVYLVSSDGKGINGLEMQTNVPFSFTIDSSVTVTIPADFLPTGRAVNDVEGAPTAEDFNALLESLREAGYISLW